MKWTVTALALVLGSAVCAAPDVGPGSLAHEVNAARRAGLATTTRDLRVDLPLASNAAIYWRRLAALRRANESTRYLGEDLLVRLPWSRDELAAARHALSVRADELALVAQALAVPHCYFEHDWVTDAGYTREWADVRAACRLLALKSRLELAEGRQAEAVHIALQCCAAGRQAAEEPTMIAALVATACEAIGVRELQRVLWVSGDNPAAVRAVIAASGPLCADRDAATMLRGEALMTIMSSQLLVKKGPKFLGMIEPEVRDDQALWNRIQRDPIEFRRFMESQTAGILWLMRQAQPAMRMRADRAFPRLARLSGRVSKRARTDARLKLAALVAPVYADACTHVARGQGEARVTLAAAKVLEWRIGHGSLPVHLAQAVQPAPLDPFDGRPLRYRREGAGFVIYSVGQSHKFVGGRRGVRAPGSQVLFRWPKDQPRKR